MSNNTEAPKERGMIFNSEMVRAILDGRKTQTRRQIKWRQTRFTEIAELDNGMRWPWSEDCEYGGDYWHPCPYGKVGDRIWVRETFSTVPDNDEPAGCSAILYAADGNGPYGKWRPSIHMPREYSRITLEITGIRVERLSYISEEDARAEGVSQLRGGFWKHYQPGWTQHQLNARGSFLTLWDSIYGDDAWQSNPWVWVIEFKRVEASND